MLDKVVAAVEAEADRLVEEFHRPAGPRGHDGHCEVDREIEERLRKHLQAILPGAFAGEETGMSPGSKAGFTWLVDPHDGTFEFMHGRRGSAISVALLRGAQPVLGVVCSPMSPDRGRDTIAWAEGARSIQRNGRPLTNDLSRQSIYPDAFVWATASAARRTRRASSPGTTGSGSSRSRAASRAPWSAFHGNRHGSSARRACCSA